MLNPKTGNRKKKAIRQNVNVSGLFRNYLTIVPAKIL
ncbi:hypothetical protein MNBD_ALPHA06-311 [hydrothermal vent metagenome]|uniref:Uncharacterized protein n=1 Tax=hydrothermal vent metagenome TaxID=652676 RepID=A0A3B0SC95_9ZZZZ